MYSIYQVVMMNINSIFATPDNWCDLSSKLCKRQGKCLECPDAQNMIHFDYDKVNQVIEDMLDQ